MILDGNNDNHQSNAVEISNFSSDNDDENEVKYDSNPKKDFSKMSNLDYLRSKMNTKKL